MTAVKPILEARGLMKRYGTVVAMNGADFDLMPGEICAVIGDNGAGKSTLIKALSGAVTPDHGSIELDGRTVHFRSPEDARAEGIETVYQNLAMSPALSIADNMFLGREWRKPGIAGSIFRKMDRRRMEAFARDKLSELQSQFDFADPSMANSKRGTTIVPQQALFFMNNPLSVEVARAVAGLPFPRLVLDGEVVCLDDDARPSFQRLQKRALLQRASEIDWGYVGEIGTLGISAGASAPEVIVDEIIDAFRQRFDAKVELAITAEENEHFLVNRELRDVELTREDMAWVNG